MFCLWIFNMEFRYNKVIFYIYTNMRSILLQYFNFYSREICNDNSTTLMCPQCDRKCDYWELQDTCKSSKMNYLIDNHMTVIFAFVMSVWGKFLNIYVELFFNCLLLLAVLYLEFWKRYSAGLIHRWGLTGFSLDIEHPRTQYLAKLRNSKHAQKTLQKGSVLDNDVPYWSTKFLPKFTSFSIMVLFVSFIC